VYIGELEHPFQQIKEDDNDTAHINDKMPETIKFKFASEDHADLVGKNLAPSEGVTHGVFAKEY
jgi:hypothetical protein